MKDWQVIDIFFAAGNQRTFSSHCLKVSGTVKPHSLVSVKRKAKIKSPKVNTESRVTNSEFIELRDVYDVRGLDRR